ncbi:MAG: hypothetical protein ACQCN4_05100 [Candidatus Bathyarchaeia archaeon]
MSGENEKLDQLLAKVEEMSTILTKVSEELKSVSASLKSLAVGQITQPPTVRVATSTTKPAPTPAAPKPSAAPGETSKTRSIEDIRMSFPEELEARLGFEEKGDYIIIKPKQFLGSDNFAKIASAIRGMGGEYISAGKDSHFRVPKKKQ